MNLKQCHLLKTVPIIATIILGCTPMGIYDSRNICGNRRSCGLGNPYFANILEQGKVLFINFENSSYPRDYLGVQFNEAIVHTTEEICRLDSLDAEGTVFRKIQEIQVEWTEKQKSEFKTDVEADIVKIFSTMQGNITATQPEWKAAAKASIGRTVDNFVAGKAKYTLGYYELSSDDTKALKSTCGVQGAVSSVAVAKMEGAHMVEDFEKQLLAELKAAIGYNNIVEAELKAAFDGSIKQKITRTFENQSFICSVGWAGRQ